MSELSPDAADLAGRRAERPTDETLAWVGRTLGGRVVSSRRLTGGISAGMDVVEMERGSERELVVLRRFVNDVWLSVDPDLAAREARVLEHLEVHGVAAPRLLAVDGDGAGSGAVCLVMSHVPGRTEHRPADWSAWLDGLVTTLLEIHRVPVTPDLGLRDHDALVDADVHVTRPVRYGHPVDEELWAVVAATWPSVTRRPATLVHADFHPGNVLWDAGQVSAVVDWTIACVGQAMADLSYLRLDVSLAIGLDVGDEVSAAYRRITGEDIEDRPFWDFMAAVRAHGFVDTWWGSYVDFGLTELTLDVAEQRFADFTARARSELGS
jgi:aminoglycoside phosphotransferase (APT) family kinase protein